MDVKVVEEAAIAQAHAALMGALKFAGMRPSDLARRLGCTQPNVNRMFTANLTVRTLARVFAACGYRIEIVARRECDMEAGK